MSPAAHHRAEVGDQGYWPGGQTEPRVNKAKPTQPVQAKLGQVMRTVPTFTCEQRLSGKYHSHEILTG